MPFSSAILQLQYKLQCSLSTYAALVKGKEWEFPSFDACCPICKAAGCARPHGFYVRPAVEGDGKGIDVPIMRGICHRKGKVDAHAHRTFSLLPHALVPYHRYCATVQYETFKQAVKGGTEGALDALQAVFDKFCERSIFFVILLFQAAFQFLVVSRFVEQTHQWQEALVALIDSYPGGLLELIVAFYAAEQEFLLGIPSQGRKQT